LVAAHADAPPSRTTLKPEVDSPGARSADDVDEGVGESAGDSPDAAIAAAEEIARRVRSAYGLPHTLATPIVAGRRFLGALLLARRGRDDWSEGDRRLLTWAANEVATAFSRAYALEAAERGAKIDALTGLPNRRYFDEVLAIERPRRRAHDSLGVLMIDIDHFKILNDRFGHATGDRVLRAVAGAIAQGVRDEDTPARYGGEEFAVLLRETSAEQAMEVGERVRRSVVRLHPASLGIDEPVTVSVGVAVAGANQVAIPGLVGRADQALYRAKRLGRDRVVAA
jgi:diguanylate cyclase (GGDEF)-like protein